MRRYFVCAAVLLAAASIVAGVLRTLTADAEREREWDDWIPT